MEYSIKYQQIQPSVTMAVTAKAAELRSNGVDVISFSAGEPDFATPKNICDVAIKYLEDGHIGYTAAAGLPKLRQVIADKLKKDNHLEYKMTDIVVSNGAKHAIRNVVEAITNPGDEWIIPSPYWVTYAELVKMSSGVPVIVETREENEFKITAEELEKAITPKTKAIFLNTPCNPTGAVYTEEELEQIAALAVKHDVMVISDEIYEKLIYDGKHISIAALNEEIKDRTIVVNGVSKAYAMTGWRIGYTASNSKIAKIISSMQSHTTSNPNTLAQYAAIEALEGEQETVEQMKVEFEQRRNLIVEKIEQLPLVSVKKPKGAFYVMLNIDQCKGKKYRGTEIKDSLGFAELLLEHANVAVVPGIAFGADDFVRLSYATSREKIEEGMKRIGLFLNELQS